MVANTWVGALRWTVTATTFCWPDPHSSQLRSGISCPLCCSSLLPIIPPPPDLLLSAWTSCVLLLRDGVVPDVAAALLLQPARLVRSLGLSRRQHPGSAAAIQALQIGALSRLSADGGDGRLRRAPCWLEGVLHCCRTDRNTGGTGRTDAQPVAALLCLGAKQEGKLKVVKGGDKHQEENKKVESICQEQNKKMSNYQEQDLRPATRGTSRRRSRLRRKVKI